MFLSERQPLARSGVWLQYPIIRILFIQTIPPATLIPEQTSVPCRIIRKTKKQRGAPMPAQIVKALILFVALNFSLSAAPDETQHFRWQENGFFSRMDLDIRGTVEFTDNDSDMKTVSGDGYFRLEQWASGRTRTYLVRPVSN